TILAKAKMRRGEAINYGKKVMEAIQVVTESYVKEVNTSDLVTNAIRGMYYRVEEKLPTELSDRLNQVKDLSESDMTLLLADARERLGKREDLDNHKDIDISLQRMLLKLDPHTTYFDPETKRRLDQEMQGRFYGIGVQIRKHELTDTLQVVSPIK